MFPRLFSIENTRLYKRAMPWLCLAACGFYIFLSLHNYYTLNRLPLLNGELKMPGLSFDLATALDQVTLPALPLLVIVAASLAGSDYKLRTYQHWMMRAPRWVVLLAKFGVLALFSLALQVLTLLVAGGTGWYYKAFTFHAFNLANVNGPATLAAPLYMTLATLPYLALILLITVAARSTLVGAVIGLGWTQFIENIVTFLLHGQNWMMWHPHNLAASVSYLLNNIGNKLVEPPEYYADPVSAMAALGGYTILFLAAALWVYRRQDVGG